MSTFFVVCLLCVVAFFCLYWWCRRITAVVSVYFNVAFTSVILRLCRCRFDNNKSVYLCRQRTVHEQNVFFSFDVLENFFTPSTKTAALHTYAQNIDFSLHTYGRVRIKKSHELFVRAKCAKTKTLKSIDIHLYFTLLVWNNFGTQRLRFSPFPFTKRTKPITL